jgi:hypothetical protein
MGYGLDHRGMGIRLQAGAEVFNFFTALRQDLESTHPPIRMQHAIFPYTKWPGLETDPTHSCRAKVKNAWSYTSTSLCIFTALYLIKHKDTFGLLRWVNAEFWIRNDTEDNLRGIIWGIAQMIWWRCKSMRHTTFSLFLAFFLTLSVYFYTCTWNLVPVLCCSREESRKGFINVKYTLSLN